MDGSDPAKITVAAAAHLFAVGRTQRHSAAAAWEPPSVADLQRMLPQHEIHALLGRGGMGAVYRATQASLDREVAIKILPPEMAAGDPQFPERFKLEAKAMARLNHPGIVAVFDAGETEEGLLYFVMEYVEGTDVQAMLAARGLLPAAEALPIVARVCEVLEFAHESGFIHRDIKPSNIMIDRRGQVKVADFGLARTATEEGVGLTGSTFLIGTAEFAAPEAFRPGVQLDRRADLYAVGVMLYQMLTGALPRGRFELPSRCVTGIDERIDAIVDRAMQSNRERRYSTALEIRADLNRILGIEPGSTGPLALSGRAQLALAAPRTRGKAPPWLAVAAIVAVAAGGVMWWSRSGGAPGGESRQAGASPASDAAEKAAAEEMRHRWRPVPNKFNARMDRGAVHLVNFDTWAAPRFRIANVAVRATILWQPSPPGRNDLIKVTARLTDTGHYYACLYGSVVELGYYRPPGMIGLQRWVLEPPPGPDEAISLQIACVGHRLAIWVRDRLVGVIDDSTIDVSANVGVQAVDGHIQRLEYLDLDGLPEAEAFQRLGLDVAGSSMIEGIGAGSATIAKVAGLPGPWVNLFPDLSKLPNLAEFKDGWARLSDHEAIKQLDARDGKPLALRNGGVRMQRRVPENWPGGILLHMRSLEQGHRLNLCYFKPKTPGEKGYLQLREFRPETLPPNPTAEQAWGAQKLLAEQRIPPVGTEFTTELIVVGKTLRGSLGPHAVTCKVEDEGKAGRVAIDEANALAFRNVEVLNLDGLTAAEALKVVGLAADAGAQPASGERVPLGGTAPNARWRDAFAESPLKEVIAKAEHTAQGYRLPANNHWAISPRPQRSGAVRIRATSSSGKFVSLYFALDDGKQERLRFVPHTKECVLSYGSSNADETDFATKSEISPFDGQAHEILFVRMDGRLRVTMDGQLLHDAADQSQATGRCVVDIYPGADIRVEKVEYLELDGVPSAAAQKLLTIGKR